MFRKQFFHRHEKCDFRFLQWVFERHMCGGYKLFNINKDSAPCAAASRRLLSRLPMLHCVTIVVRIDCGVFVFRRQIRRASRTGFPASYVPPDPVLAPFCHHRFLKVWAGGQNTVWHRGLFVLPCPFDRRTAAEPLVCKMHRRESRAAQVAPPLPCPNTAVKFFSPSGKAGSPSLH